jgi:hypothetical protein
MVFLLYILDILSFSSRPLFKILLGHSLIYKQIFLYQKIDLDIKTGIGDFQKPPPPTLFTANYTPLYPPVLDPKDPSYDPY